DGASARRQFLDHLQKQGAKEDLARRVELKMDRLVAASTGEHLPTPPAGPVPISASGPQPKAQTTTTGANGTPTKAATVPPATTSSGAALGAKPAPTAADASHHAATGAAATDAAHAGGAHSDPTAA